MKTALLGTVIVSLTLLASCSKSSSSDDNKGTEAPLTLEGKTLSGGIYVDYREGEGFELEAKDLVFTNGSVTFTAIEYDSNDNMVPRQVTGPYKYEKADSQTGTLSTATNPISFYLNLAFSGDTVTATGTMAETHGHGDYQAKGVFKVNEK